MKFNIRKKTELSGIVCPSRGNYSVHIVFMFFLLFIPVLLHAAGQAQWENQVNDAFRQARKSASGLKGQARTSANYYINQAETAWNKLKYNYQPVWYLQQQYQKQNQMNLLFMQQQNLNTFLQQKMKSDFRTLELQTINPFGDYRFHGVSLHPKDGRLHGPGTIADTPALANLFRKQDSGGNGLGMNALSEMRRLENAEKTSSKQPSGKALEQAASINRSGQWDNPAGGDKDIAAVKSDNPYKYDSSVVDLTGIDSPTPRLLRKNESNTGAPVINGPDYNPYAEMSDERLKKKEDALKEALRGIQKLSSENAAGYSQIEAGSREGVKDAGKVMIDAGTTLVLGSNTLLMAKPDGTIPSGLLKMSNDGAGYAVDANSMWEAAKNKQWGDAAAQAAMTSANVLIDTKNINATPLSAIPGTVKLGLDTALVWGNYLVQRKELTTRNKTAEQLDAARQKLTRQLNEVILEQKRRNSYKIP
ncbi:MAG: hypothetical protein PHV82_00815 [Victivallaceae bacterium]|nr:hypothetical protein [Victivallaceae bacterium]